MSTRAVYVFHDANDEIAVYKDHDGYPSGAVQWIEKALAHAWPLPRFEADEFAAAFAAANKPSGAQKAAEVREQAETIKDPDIKAMRLEDAKNYLPGGRYAGFSGGGVRLMSSSKRDAFPGDIEFYYRVGCVRGKLHVEAFQVAWRGDRSVDKRIFKGSLDAMRRRHGSHSKDWR